jgi:hypothetical protein
MEKHAEAEERREKTKKRKTKMKEVFLVSTINFIILL